MNKKIYALTIALSCFSLNAMDIQPTSLQRFLASWKGNLITAGSNNKKAIAKRCGQTAGLFSTLGFLGYAAADLTKNVLKNGFSLNTFTPKTTKGYILSAATAALFLTEASLFAFGKRSVLCKLLPENLKTKLNAKWEALKAAERKAAQLIVDQNALAEKKNQLTAQEAIVSNASATPEAKAAAATLVASLKNEIATLETKIRTADNPV